MALKAILESTEGVDDALMEHYVEGEDGKFRLDVESVGGWALEDVAGLKKSLATERKGNREGSSLRKKYERDGEMLDPGAAWDALEQLNELQDNPPADGDDKIQKLTEQFTEKEKRAAEKFQRELEELRTANTALDQQLDNTLVETALLSAIGKHEGNAKWIMPEAKKYVRPVVGPDGKKVLRVFEGDGVTERITSKSGSQDPMNAEEFIGTVLKTDPDFLDAFKGSGASGSGATGLDKTIRGSTHLISADDAKNPTKYRQAKERADKAGVTLAMKE